MPNAELLTAYWPGWLACVVAFILAFNKLAEESYKFASLFGRWGKKIHAKALERHHINLAAEQFANAIRDAVEKARDEWEGEENEAIKALDQRLGTVSRVTTDQTAHINDLLFQVRCLTAYTDYEGLWHNRFRVAAARSGDGHMSLDDLPNHIGYYEFEAKYREDDDWRKWIDL